MPSGKFTTPLEKSVPVDNYPHLKSCILFPNKFKLHFKLIGSFYRFAFYNEVSTVANMISLYRDFHFYPADVAVKGGEKRI